jgi:ribosomal protein S18 acetylase RimI-like enzyme
MTARFRIEQLFDHDRSTFSSGIEPLDRYLRRQASQNVKRKGAVCTVATERATGRLAGYYTLSAASIALTDLPAELQRKLPRYPTVPAARIGRLAVDRAFQGQGLGAALLNDAFARVMVSGMGVFAALVDAKDDNAVRFYENHGFVLLGSGGRMLFLPLASAKV